MTTKKIGRPPKAVTANELLRMAEKLSPEEREKLRRYGAIVPEGTADLDDPGDSTWGLRCRNCNRVALRFLGTRWNGFPVPPAGTRLRDLPWTQDNCVPNRDNPNCQWCGAGPNLGTSGGILPPGKPHYGIVMLKGHEQLSDSDIELVKETYPDFEVEDYEARHEQAYSKAEARRIRNEHAKMSVDLQGTSQTFTKEGTIGDSIDKVAQTGVIGVPDTPAAAQVGPGGQPAGRTAAVMEATAEMGGLNAAVEGGFRPIGRG